MASTRKLKRNFSDSEDSDSKSEFKTETKNMILQRPKKKKVFLESDSENESVLSNQNITEDDEKLSSTSDEDEPLKVSMSKKKEKKKKIPASFDTADDEPLAVKSKISVKNLETNKKAKILNSGYEKNGSHATSDEDEPLNRVAEKSKAHTSSDSSDDEILAVKSKNLSTQSNPRRKSGNLSSLSGEKGYETTSDEDKPIGNVNNVSKLKEEVHNSSHSSDDEPLISESRNNSKLVKIENTKSLEFGSKENELEITSDDDEPIRRKVAKTTKLKRKSKDFDYSSDNSEEPVVAKTKKPAKHSESKKEAESHNSEVDEDVSEATSDEEPISKIATLTKSKELVTSSSNSDDEPLAAKSRNSSKYLKTNKKIKNLDSESEENKSDLTSDADEQPLNIIAKSSKTNGNSKADTATSSSDDELLVTKNKTSTQMKNSKKDGTQNPQSVRNGHNTSDEEPISKFTTGSKSKEKHKKKENSSSSSDDEPLAIKKSVKRKSMAQENGDLSSDDEDNHKNNLSKTQKEKINNKKDKNTSNGKIEHLKKYLRIAGIHIKSYDKLFENCKSIKSKTEKLLDILHEKGLKGRPTIEKCKKLKKKIETKKEIAELDTSNIIKSEGRPKRGAGGKIIEKVQNTGSSPAAKKFSRLRDIIDSEESD